MKMVSDKGAMSLLWPWNASRTDVSMNPSELDRGLSLPPTGGHGLRGPWRRSKNDAENDGERHRVDVQRKEIAFALVPDPRAVGATHL
jgi:hypothetical protein